MPVTASTAFPALPRVDGLPHTPFTFPSHTSAVAMPGFFPCFLSLLFLLLHSLLVAGSPDDTVVVTSSGPIKGKKVTTDSGTVTAYLGIPYAEPPLGELRFQKSRPHQPWNDVLEVTSFGNSCPQRKVSNNIIPDGGAWAVNTPLSEDCLFLNLWVPQQSEPAPVLVWIHGGGFVSGTASLDLYNGAMFAATEKVIVASINYRLGLLGFLYLPPAAPGNVGLWDQHLAVTWVKENAAAFGGDPDLLTLLGHSAGAASVGFHLLSPASQPLFARAVLQSGAPNAPWAWQSPEQAKENALKLGRSLSCTQEDHSAVVSCLQKKAYEEIDFDSFTYLFGTTTDGDFLLDEPQKLIKAGRIQGKPVLTGVTADEGSAMVFYLFPDSIADGTVVTQEQLLEGMRKYMRGAAESAIEALALKYVEDDDSPGRYSRAMAQLSRDNEFVCPMTDFAAKLVEAGSPVYAYFFTHYTSGSLWPEWAGVTHGAEVPYLFGTIASVQKEGQSYTDEEDALNGRVMRYWASFARSWQPTESFPTEEPWPLYDAAKQNFYRISTESPEVVQKSPAQRCDFLATHNSNSEKDFVSPEKEEDGKHETRM
ncbi:cholinesterase-like [Tiliqua scincoides]|uniref:cholinesterase-like n=1 Tax=Tiliqua scincoides TaxID=71010 RepID=UPI0034636B98